MKKIELLAPAGDLERLKVTLLYGADAVYIGGEKFSLRANATNFSLSDMREGSKYAHSLGKKIYLTLNIVFHEEEIEEVDSYISDVVDAGIDAVIVSDPFIISHIKNKYDIEVHLSTQACTTNYESSLFFREEGVDRIVLARELSKKEIQEIITKTGIDVEVFIHGAMCTFYSGRCVLSNYLTNRDSNRGGCSQVCRFAFQLEQENNQFTMATKDLNLSAAIPELIQIGVSSLKVEGRMRSLYYLATVIGCYRKLIDFCYNQEGTPELIEKQNFLLKRVANRETSTHYFFKQADRNDQYYTGRQELSNQEFLALILSYDDKQQLLKITQRNYFKVGDCVEIFNYLGEEYSFIVTELYNENHEKIELARHPEEILYLRVSIPIQILEYTMMRMK